MAAPVDQEISEIDIKEQNEAYNRDGLLSLDEFVTAHVKYMTDPYTTLEQLPLYGLAVGQAHLQLHTHPELVRKWEQLFWFSDLDNDGKQTFRDHEIVKERLMKNANLTPERRADMTKMYDDVWTDLGTDPSVGLSRVDWMNLWNKVFHDGTLPTMITQLATRYFRCMDLNDDGFIDLKEFRSLEECFGKCDTPLLDVAFRVIDSNHDGLLSLGEFVTAHVKYMTDPYTTLEQLPLYGLAVGQAQLQL